MQRTVFTLAFLLPSLLVGSALAQNRRDELIRQDRELWSQVEAWHYDDLEAARDRAAIENKPLMVVLRCVP